MKHNMTHNTTKHKFAMLVSGCGYLDGAEISETVCTMFSMDRHDIAFDTFALNRDQKQVCNHITNEEVTEKRNMLEESARITRKIHDIDTLKVSDYDALVIPGGFGVAKNFSDLAFAGDNFEVDEKIQNTIEQFINFKKPIGAICIAPAILARVFVKNGLQPKVTLGESNPLLNAIGAEEVICSANDIVVDEVNNIVSTPAFMLWDKVRLCEIADGIEKLIIQLRKMCS